MQACLGAILAPPPSPLHAKWRHCYDISLYCARIWATPLPPWAALGTSGEYGLRTPFSAITIMGHHKKLKVSKLDRDINELVSFG